MPSRKHEESFGQEMVIEDVQLDDAGEYECLAYNELVVTPTKHSFTIRVEGTQYSMKRYRQS